MDGPEGPKDLISEVYRVNMLLGPMISDNATRKAFEEYSRSLDALSRDYETYELALHRLRQAVEKEHDLRTGG
jgi:hypothetical protein